MIKKCKQLEFEFAKDYDDPIQNKDCIEYLKDLPNNSVDLVLTDPPYSIGYQGEKWDKQLPNELSYLGWCQEWTELCAKKLKPNRMMVIWGTLKTKVFMKYDLKVLEKISGFYCQNEIIWGYNWGGRQKINFARKHEYTWCYSKGKEFLFNADDIRVDRKIKSDMNKSKKLLQEYKDKYKEEHDGKEPSKKEIAKHKKEKIEPQITLKKGTIPTCVWSKNNHTTAKDYCGWHPTTKNIFLLERIIKAYTNPGDTVLDIFMGSGSTMIACNNTGRLGIGCEFDEEYYKKSLERIKELDKARVM